MAQLFETMVEQAIGTDYIDVVCAFDTSGSFYSTVGGSNDGPFNYDIYFDSLSTGYADPSGILTRIGTEEVENVGAYIVPEFDELIDKALNAATFDERLQYFAEAEAFLLDHAFAIPFSISSRSYQMCYLNVFEGQYASFGMASLRYKDQHLYDTSMSVEQFQAAYADWQSKLAG